MGIDDERSRAEVDEALARRSVTLTTGHEGVLEVTSRPDDATRYQLKHEIGRGGGGRVIAAMDRRLGREVAAKLPLDRPSSVERLVREAQLLARLEHPSIVPVHDLVWSEDGTPFYVMKLLEGDTLRSKIADPLFDRRIAYLPTVLSVVDAVAYAHHHGIVHRDLKPGNVIVGKFGETFLIDWGLARSSGSALEDPDDDTNGAASPANMAITAIGAVVGTPVYMAPEQAAGHQVDARADVYGLGALLYHLLAGKQPYPGEDARTVLAQLSHGPPVRVEDVEPRVGPELAAIVAKAMARRPEERYATAEQLSKDLRNYQAGRMVAAHRYTIRQRARRWLARHRAPVVVTPLLGAIALLLIWAWPAPSDPHTICSRSGDKVAALWPASVRDQVTARIRGSLGPSAGVIAETIGRRFDGYSGALASARIEACEATLVRGEQSAELLDRRMSCLDHRGDDLRAAIALFDTVRADELAQLVRAADALPPINMCSDAEQLREQVQLPVDLGLRTRLLALRQREAAAEADRKSGRYEQALATSEQVMRDPATATFAPLAASAGFNFGATLVALGRTVDATPRLRDALYRAELGHDDRIRGWIWLQLGYADELARPEHARQAVEQAGAIAARIGDSDLDAYHLTMLAKLRSNEGDLVGALALKRRALERWQATGHDDLVLADLIGSLGSALTEARILDEAELNVKRALALRERLLGPDHPDVATSLSNLAQLMLVTNRSPEAVTTCERALAILQRAGLEETQAAFNQENTLGLALTDFRRYSDARARFERLLERVQHKLGVSHWLVGAILYNLGNNELQAGRSEQALSWFRRSLAWREKNVAANHIEVANARWGVAQVLIDLHRPSEAIPLLSAALPIQLEQRGPTSEDVVYTRWSLAQAYLDLGRASEAVNLAEQIQAFFRNAPHLDERGKVRLLLARALYATGRDRQRVRDLAMAARADFVASKIADDQLPALDALLAKVR